VFLALLCLIAVMLIRLNLAEPVSAKEILSRVGVAEARQLAQVSAPVIYQKLRLSRSSRNHVETATWEIWDDTKNHRIRQLVKNGSSSTRSALSIYHGLTQRPIPALPIAGELGKVLLSHGANVGMPLSSMNYAVWRDSIPEPTEAVIEGRLPNGEKAAILRVSGHGPFASDDIVEAELTVRAADWHAIGQRLRVQSHGEVVDYSLGELAFDVLVPDRLASSIFAEPVSDAVQTTHRSIEKAPPALSRSELHPAQPELPSEAELAAAEVEVWYALHSAQACIGRPIEVRRGSSLVEVEGVVDNDERKAQVLIALRGIPFVAAKITSSTESADKQGDKESPPVLEPPAPVDDSKAKLPVEDFLKRYFSAGKCAAGVKDAREACAEKEIAALSRQALAHSEQAREQAWALRRLAEWDLFRRRDKLRTSTRRLLELMVREHMTALRKELEESWTQLKPVLSLLPARQASSPRSETIETRDERVDWLAASLERLCATVDEITNLTLSTFAETNRPVDKPEVAMKDLLFKLDNVEREFPKLETDAAEELSGFSKTLVSVEKPDHK
jgi:hypothetical protein